MMRAFVINLDEEKQRLRWINTVFGEMDVPFERFPAVDKKRLPENASSMFSAASGSWSPGEMACFLSHIELWKLIANGQDKYAAVFEDDVHFSHGAAPFLREYSWIPPEVELVKLETTLAPVRLKQPQFSVNGRSLSHLKSFHNGSAGYIISKRLAGQFVAATNHIDRPVDDFMFDKGHNVICWQLSPALCIQDMYVAGSSANLASTIERGRNSARGGRRLKPKMSTLYKLDRELRRLVQKFAGNRPSAVPIDITFRLPESDLG